MKDVMIKSQEEVPLVEFLQNNDYFVEEVTEKLNKQYNPLSSIKGLKIVL